MPWNPSPAVAVARDAAAKLDDAPICIVQCRAANVAPFVKQDSILRAHDAAERLALAMARATKLKDTDGTHKAPRVGQVKK